MIGLFPAMASVVPVALGRGFRAASVPWNLAALGFLVAAAAGWLVAGKFRRGSFTAIAVAAVAGYLWFEIAAFPMLDRAASARSGWLSTQPKCLSPGVSRNLLYGLYYYAGKQLPDCALLDPDAKPVVR